MCEGCVVGCVAGLQALRLGLSGVRSLALALPALTSLDVNNTAELRCLELRCPALLTAYVQACKCASFSLAPALSSDIVCDS
jgi:hypothetical protein